MKTEEKIKSLTDDLHAAYDTIRGLEFELEKAQRSDKLDTKSTERPIYKTGLRVAMYAAKLNESVEELEKENAKLRDAINRIHYEWVNLDKGEDGIDNAICAAIEETRKDKP